MPTHYLIAIATLAAISLPAVIAIPNRWTVIGMTSIGGVMCTIVGDLQFMLAVVGVQLLTVITGEIVIRLRRRRKRR